MFDHLDDPQPWTPSDGLRATVARRGRTLRRRRHLLAGGVMTVVLLVAGVAGASTFVDRKLDSVDRLRVAGLRQTAKPVDPKVILFVGVDSDAGLSPQPRTRPYRTDTIVLARVDAGAETLALLPLPRDLLLDIPGHGKGRINQAFALGGPELLIQTIHQDLGIEVDHYLQTDFRGAVDIGDALGGLRLAFGAAVRDHNSGLARPAGCQTLGGTQLLQLGRSRHLQWDDRGRWTSDPTSDLGRIERQQAIGAAVLARLTTIDAANPAALNRLLTTVSRSLVVDAGTTNADLIALFRAIDGSRLVPVRLPVHDMVTDQGAAVLVVTGDVAAAVTPFLHAPPPGPHGPGGMPTMPWQPSTC